MTDKPVTDQGLQTISLGDLLDKYKELRREYLWAQAKVDSLEQDLAQAKEDAFRWEDRYGQLKLNYYNALGLVHNLTGEHA